MADEEKDLKDPEGEPDDGSEPDDSPDDEGGDDSKKPKVQDEPQGRFPKSDQSAGEDPRIREANRIGFENRKLKKALEDAGLDPSEVLGTPSGAPSGDPADDDSVPVSRGELKQILKTQTEQQLSESMLSEFLGVYPSYQKYAPTIRKYMNDPNYRNVPIGFIANGIAANDLEEEGAKKERGAAEKSGDSKSGGSSRRRSVGGDGSIWDLTKDQFSKKQAEVRQKALDR